MPSQSPASKASPEILYCDTMTRFLRRLRLRDARDLDVMAVWPKTRAQRIGTIQLGKHAAR
jgi:hypothetical protein